MLANDDPELSDWLFNAQMQGGGFVSAISAAGLRADVDNYRIIRPALLELKKKYPDYDRPPDLRKSYLPGDAA